jgi:predicted ABC-type ATPase
MAVERVKLRVLEGGHNIPKFVIERRFKKGWENFLSHYRNTVDAWVVFDNSGEIPILLDES